MVVVFVSININEVNVKSVLVLKFANTENKNQFVKIVEALKFANTENKNEHAKVAEVQHYAKRHIAKRQEIKSKFINLANSQAPNGIYALIDYINFKGEG